MSINSLFLSDVIVQDTFDPSVPMAPLDAVGYGLQTTLIGMGVVFSVLIILWAVLGVFKLVFAKTNTKEEKTAASAAPAPTPAPEIIDEPELTPIYSEPDDTELVAVITAAVAAVMDQPQTSFRVVSFRRTAKK